MDPKINDLVQVRWLDSIRHGDGDGWLHRDAVVVEGGDMSMLSVGYVWSFDSLHSITLAPHVSVTQDQAYGALTIPMCAVESMEILKNA